MSGRNRWSGGVGAVSGGRREGWDRGSLGSRTGDNLWLDETGEVGMATVPETGWVFALLGCGYRLNFIPAGFLMG